jgi:DNA-binding protein H-NS
MRLMKQCPECSTQYEDNLSFCPKDGRALIVKTAITSKLCPQCANSIPADAVKCPYCKAESGPAPEAPQWPTREEPAFSAVPPRHGSRISTLSGAVFGFGLIFLAAGLFLIFGQKPPAELPAAAQDNNKELQQRDQKIQSLETELNRVRQELTQRSEEANELKTKLEETQKDLSTTQQQLATANREAERLASNRAQQPAASAPPRPAPTAPPPPVPVPPRRAAPPGTYETIRPTTVYEEASGSSRVLTKVAKGTRVEVVRSSGDWLEVRSKHGNPPGFVRADDAMFISSSSN